MLAGVGQRDGDKQNFLVVKPGMFRYFDVYRGSNLTLRIILDTDPALIESTFKEFTNRPDIAIILINQYVSSEIAVVVISYISCSWRTRWPI